MEIPVYKRSSFYFAVAATLVICWLTFYSSSMGDTVRMSPISTHYHRSSDNSHDNEVNSDKANAIANKQPTASPRLTYEECSTQVNHIAKATSFTEPNWAIYNQQEETLELIEAAGGLTPNMRAFMEVYEKHVWGTGSGVGSALSFARGTICILSNCLGALLGVSLLIDMPCGDQQWAPTLRLLTPELKYIGVDGMPGVVQANRERFGHAEVNGNTEFFLMDMAGKDLFSRIRKQSKLWKPEDKVAVLSRHVFEHNTYESSFAYIAELHKSGATYLIGTTALVSKVPSNPHPNEMVAGGYKAINFHAAPFNFPQGIMRWFETGQKADDGTTEMEIWRIDDLPTSFTLNM